MKLILQHARNPDISDGGYWVSAVDPKFMAVPVVDLRAARAAFVDWRARNGLGGGNMTKRCGDVVLEGVVVAHFSYNGRCWTPGDFPNCTEISIA